MPFVLVITGVVLLIAAIKNTYGQTTPSGSPGLGALLQNDFTGQNNFIFWLVAMLVIGAIGYIPKLKPVSIGLLVLVVAVLVLSRGNPNNVGGGLFSQFTTALNSTTTATPAATTAPTTTASTATATPGLPTLPSISQFLAGN